MHRLTTNWASSMCVSTACSAMICRPILSSTQYPCIRSSTSIPSTTSCYPSTCVLSSNSGNIRDAYPAYLYSNLVLSTYSFMPKLLASGNTTVFHWDANVTPPKSLTEWGTLVSTLVQHLVDRYGLAEVQQWYFECWNEPNLGVFWTGTQYILTQKPQWPPLLFSVLMMTCWHTRHTGTQQQYFELYATTAAAVKGVSSTLRVGGPATAGTGWLPEFIKFVQVSEPPYYTFHIHSFIPSAYSHVTCHWISRRLTSIQPIYYPNRSIVI